MALDFPSSPTIGQTFTSGTMTWEWDGTAWNIVTVIIPPIADDDQPTDPYNGQLWWNANNGKLYTWYVDVNSGQWVQTAGHSGAAYKTAETRNRVVNPAMQVSQENGDTGATITGVNYWPVDQWFATASIAAASAGRVLVANGLSPRGNRALYAGVSTAKPTLAAGDYLQILQNIEGLQVADLQWGTPTAEQVVVRFSAWANVAGTYTFNLVNSPTYNRTFLAPFTLPTANTWAEFIVVIPGDTTGTWDKGGAAGLRIGFAFLAGTTYATGVPGWQAGSIPALTGISNGASMAGGTLYIADVGLHRDPLKTGKAPPFETPDYGDALERCRRYWQNLGMVELSYVDARQQIVTSMPTPMRTTPVLANLGGDGGFNMIGPSSFRQGTAASAFRGCTLTFNARM